MIEAIVIVLVVLWLLGLLTSYTMGGVIHVLLIIAVDMSLLRVLKVRRI